MFTTRKTDKYAWKGIFFDEAFLNVSIALHVHIKTYTRAYSVDTCIRATEGVKLYIRKTFPVKRKTYNIENITIKLMMHTCNTLSSILCSNLNDARVLHSDLIFVFITYHIRCNYTRKGPQ